MASSSDAESPLTINIPGWTEVTGHTEYIIKTTVGENHFAVQHRFSNFIEVRDHPAHSLTASCLAPLEPPVRPRNAQLHEALAAKLSKLPAAFPIAKSMFSGESVKRDREKRLQEYLRNCLRLSGDRPPAALLKFLRVDPKLLAPPSAAGGATGDAMPAAGAPITAFNPFGQVFVPEKPDDVNEGLREAIKAGDVPLCMELISAKADPNYRDRQGNTPLHMAALFQRTDVAKTLLLAGSDLTLKNGANELPERMASVSLKMKFNKFKSTGEVSYARRDATSTLPHLPCLVPPCLADLRAHCFMETCAIRWNTPRCGGGGGATQGRVCTVGRPVC